VCFEQFAQLMCITQFVLCIVNSLYLDYVALRIDLKHAPGAVLNAKLTHYVLFVNVV
jgi:hypothetical protein